MKFVKGLFETSYKSRANLKLSSSKFQANIKLISRNPPPGDVLKLLVRNELELTFSTCRNLPFDNVFTLQQ